MTKLFAWLGAAMLVAICGSTRAHAGDPLKPYVVFILDTSGSMDATTGSGPPSCGGADNRLNHARCAINRIVNSYGDMVFALGRFRETPGGTFASSCDANGNVDGFGGDQCTSTGVNCSACACNGATTACNTTNCTAAMRGDARAEMLTGLVDGGNAAAATWTDFSCGTCGGPGTPLANQPEIWGLGSWTPLGGSLLGAGRYWSGQQASDGSVIWPAANPGFDPIRRDPLALSFLPRPGSGTSTCDPNPATCNNAANCTGANCCCLEQCRPYITILLTDGDETCGGHAPNAAASLLSTTVDNRRYRIETKPIGFGIAPGDADIEAIAQAGGAPNGPGNEGFYAADEAGLQLAISNILDDAIRAESCNNLDDDCDTLVDEDFPNKNGACNNGQPGVCRVDGTFTCRLDGSNTECNAGAAACNGVPAGGACTVTNSAGTNVAGTCQAGACVPTPQTEICNTLDDDCDGKVDENLSNCTCAPQGEQCDGDDDDCDGTIDEGVSKPCGTGTCVGTQTCVVGGTGTFGPCVDGNGNPVQQPTSEVCNGLDDNCDGIRDGLEAACSTMPPLPPENFPIDDPRNNPGHPSNMPIPQNACQPGKKVCPIVSGPPNQFGACQGEIKPCNSPTGVVDGCADLCDGIDVDCDNLVDEDFQSADCSTNCGLGSTQCVNGQIVCNSMPVGNDNTCNNIDDDCDTKIDEGWVSPGACGAGPPPMVCNGMVQCQMGVEVCVGDPIGQESCNCEDDDCDGTPDNGNLCGGGASCVFCQCALPCAQDEFPCPMGKFCKQDPGSGASFCIADPCFNYTCPTVPGVKQVCRPNANGNAPVCLSACDPSVVQCAANEVCIAADGVCKPDNCETFPNYCTADELCIAGVCKKDLCKNVQCGANQYCVQGQCYGSCAGVDCPDGQRCRMGMCEADPCGKQCPFGQVCIEADGMCKPDPCQAIPCPNGQYCNPQTSSCEDDPCAGTTCPGAGQVCKGGTCFDGEDLLPDAAEETRITTGGGGGCSTGGGGGVALLLGVLAFAGRRRKGGRS